MAPQRSQSPAQHPEEIISICPLCHNENRMMPLTVRSDICSSFNQNSKNLINDKNAKNLIDDRDRGQNACDSHRQISFFCRRLPRRPVPRRLLRKGWYQGLGSWVQPPSPAALWRREEASPPGRRCPVTAAQRLLPGTGGSEAGVGTSCRRGSLCRSWRRDSELVPLPGASSSFSFGWAGASSSGSEPRRGVNGCLEGPARGSCPAASGAHTSPGSDASVST